MAAIIGNGAGRHGVGGAKWKGGEIMGIAQRERSALCDLLVEVGPTAPTLCGDWTAADLVSHLLVRERRPDAALGILIKPLASYAERVAASFGARPWQDQLDLLRSGPPRFTPMGLADELVNTIEFFVHHEDVRRAASSWEPRKLDAETESVLAKRLRLMGKMLVKSAPAGVRLVPGSGDPILAKRSEPMVTVSGQPSELVLWAYGRQAHARVDYDGDADAIEALKSASLGI